MSSVKQRKKSEAINTATTINSSSDSSESSRNFGITRWKILGRVAIAFILMFLVYFQNKKTELETFTFAGQKETVPWRGHEIKCSRTNKNKNRFPGCSPVKCKRVVIDNLFSKNDIEELLKLAKKGLSVGGSNGGASILDLHSGALSIGEKFVNIYNLTLNGKNIITKKDLDTYRAIKDKIQSRIIKEFEIKSNLYLTYPTFFSEITSKRSRTVHDEYWHVHVDHDTYKAFDYTSLLYLNDYDVDFTGGRFVFVDRTNMTVEPKAGRLSIFTSGYENPHHVEKVTSGTRYAITIPFTCDKQHSISDPK